MPLFPRLRSGDKLRVSAAGFNAAMDVAEAFREGRLDRLPIQSTDRQGLILVRNSSGSDLARFAVLGVDVPAILPSVDLPGFKNAVVFNGVTPAAGHVGKFCVLQAPIANGSIGVAVISDVTQVSLNVISSAHAWADADAGVTATIKTAATGTARILWKESGTGTKWGIVALGAASPLEAPTEDGTVFCSKSDLSGGEWVRDVDIGQNVAGKAGILRIKSPDANGDAIVLDGSLVTAPSKKITINTFYVCDTATGTVKQCLIPASAPF
jgi:hypothetical protein